MIVSINQPAYLPWLGYFDRIRRSDLHIVLDHVQFEKGSYTNRCRIKQRDGREMWLTVPVEKGKPINETKIIGTTWKRKHEAALRQAYEYELDFGTGPSDNLMRAVEAALPWQFETRAVPTTYSSWHGGSKLGVKSDLVLNLCKNVGADTYLSGPQGRNYLDLPAFDKAGIEVLYHDYPSDGDNGLSAVHHLFTGAVQWAKTSLDYSHHSEAEQDPGDHPDPLQDQDPGDQQEDLTSEPSSPVRVVVGPGTTEASRTTP